MIRRFSFSKSARPHPGFSGKAAGLSVVEAVGMVVLAGVLAGMAYPAIAGLRQSGLNQQAIGIAQAINQAQQTFNLRVANAETQWEAATDSASKYGLIWNYIPYASSTLSGYTPSGYTLTLNSTLNSKVSITDPSGNPIGY